MPGDTDRAVEAGLRHPDDDRFDGYREGRAAVWREVRDWAAENLAVAEGILGHPVVTADDVRGILSPEHAAAPSRPAAPELRAALDVETLHYALEEVDPVAFGRDGTPALSREDVDHFLYAGAVAAAYTRLVGGTATCYRYWGSDGTLCAAHHGRFASASSVRCAASSTEDTRLRHG